MRSTRWILARTSAATAISGVRTDLFGGWGAVVAGNRPIASVASGSGRLGTGDRAIGSVASGSGRAGAGGVTCTTVSSAFGRAAARCANSIDSANWRADAYRAPGFLAIARATTLSQPAAIIGLSSEGGRGSCRKTF